MANWYKRSRNSEHNWDQFCIELLALLKSGNAWFATVGETMSGFFRKRRSVTLVQEADVTYTDGLKGNVESDLAMPDVKVRTLHSSRTVALRAVFA